MNKEPATPVLHTKNPASIDPVCGALIEALGLDPRDYKTLAKAIRASGGAISETRVRLVVTGHQSGNVVRADLAKLACLRWSKELEQAGEGDRAGVHARWAHLVQGVLAVPAIAEVWKSAALSSPTSSWRRVAEELRSWVQTNQSGVLLPNP